MDLAVGQSALTCPDLSALVLFKKGKLTNTTTCVALLAIGGSWLRAVGRLVSWLSTVVAQPLGGLACLGKMSD